MFGKATLRERGLLDTQITLPLPFTLNYRGGANSDGCIVGNITHTAFDAVMLNDGGTWTDDTTHAGAATGDAEILPSSPATGDYCVFGLDTPFSGMKVNIKTAATGTAGNVKWQYYSSSGWSDLSGNTLEDDSSVLQTGTSTYVITFNPPSDWVKTTLNGKNYYYVRLYATTITDYSQPVATQVWALPVDTGTGVPVNVRGKINKATFFADTNSATNADTVFLLVNLTRGVTQKVTWTKGNTILTQTGLSLYVNPGDELVVQQLDEDGTTEYANGAIVLNVSTDY
jgi:hypothetical protein